MRNKIFMIAIACFIISLAGVPTSISAMEQNSNSVADFETYATKTEWRYKIENGKTYKRLYDCTNRRWVGNWILC